MWIPVGSNFKFGLLRIPKPRGSFSAVYEARILQIRTNLVLLQYFVNELQWSRIFRDQPVLHTVAPLKAQHVVQSMQTCLHMFTQVERLFAKICKFCQLRCLSRRFWAQRAAAGRAQLLAERGSTGRMQISAELVPIPDASRILPDAFPMRSGCVGILNSGKLLNEISANSGKIPANLGHNAKM